MFWEHANYLRKRGLLTDIKIVTNDDTGQAVVLNAHRVILACSSEYFKSQLQNNKLLEPEYYFSELNAGSVQHVLNYLYGQPLDWTSIDKTLISCYQAAREFKIATLCELFAERLLKANRCDLSHDPSLKAKLRNNSGNTLNAEKSEQFVHKIKQIQQNSVVEIKKEIVSDDEPSVKSVNESPLMSKVDVNASALVEVSAPSLVEVNATSLVEVNASSLVNVNASSLAAPLISTDSDTDIESYLENVNINVKSKATSITKLRKSTRTTNNLEVKEIVRKKSLKSVKVKLLKKHSVKRVSNRRNKIDGANKVLKRVRNEKLTAKKKQGLHKKSGVAKNMNHELDSRDDISPEFNIKEEPDDRPLPKRRGRPPGRQKKHWKDMNELGEFVCKLCGKCYKNYKHLKLHYLVHEGTKNHQCKVCKKCFTRPDGLYMHMTSHRPHAERPHVCPKCDKRFNKKHELNSHFVALHSSEKPFQCEQCGKSFPWDKSLKEHLKSHDPHTVRPYECDICHMKFRRRYDLQRHLVKHAPTKPFTCDMCGRGFTQLCSLTKHKRDTCMQQKERRINKLIHPTGVSMTPECASNLTANIHNAPEIQQAQQFIGAQMQPNILNPNKINSANLETLKPIADSRQPILSMPVLSTSEASMVTYQLHDQQPTMPMPVQMPVAAIPIATFSHLYPSAQVVPNELGQYTDINNMSNIQQ